MAEKIVRTSGPWLFERSDNTEHDIDLNPWIFRLPHALEVYKRETFGRERKRDLLDIFRAFSKRESFFGHLGEGFQFMSDLDIADRAANGLMLALVYHNKDKTNKSAFGVKLNYAYNNPRLSDHNHPHNRRAERYSEAMVLNIGELRHQKSIRLWLDSLLLYDKFHDDDQLYSLQLNEIEPNSVPDVKKGHGLAAAIMMLLFHKRYALERKVSIHRAWEICAGAAAMMMIHDEPDKFFQRLSADNKAQDLIKGVMDKHKQIEKLTEAFENSQVDIFSLSPTQLLGILKRIKGAAEGYGLPKELVEEYRDDLKELEENQSPLLKDFTTEQRESFNLTAEVALLADLMDMRIPAEEAIFRSLKAQKSINRQFIPQEFDQKEILRKIFEGDGEYGEDSYNSDVLRMLWEALHMTTITTTVRENDPIINSRYISRLAMDASITSIIALREVGVRLMRREFSVVDEVYQRRIERLVDKSLVRVRFSLPKTLDIFDLVAFIKRKDFTLGERLEEEIDNLRREQETIKSNLEQKIPHAYSQESIGNFEKLTEVALEHIYQQKKVGRWRKRYYQRLVQKHGYPHTIPFRTYDSIGIYPPRRLVKEIGLLTIAEMRAFLNIES